MTGRRRPAPADLSPLERAVLELVDDRLDDLRGDLRRQAILDLVALVLVAAVAVASMGRDLFVDAPGVKVGTTSTSIESNDR